MSSIQVADLRDKRRELEEQLARARALVLRLQGALTLLAELDPPSGDNGEAVKGD